MKICSSGACKILRTPFNCNIGWIAMVYNKGTIYGMVIAPAG